MSNERAKVNDSDLLASREAGSRPSRRTFLTSLASAGLLLYVAPSSLAKPASAATVNARVVLRWNDALLAAIPATRMPSTISNRAMAIVHTAVYDAWTPYTERALPTQSGPPDLPAAQRASGRCATRARRLAMPPVPHSWTSTRPRPRGSTIF